MISELRGGWVFQSVWGGLGQVLGSAHRAVLSWLNLAQVHPGGECLVGDVFGILGLVSELELFLHGLVQKGT